MEHYRGSRVALLAAFAGIQVTPGWRQGQTIVTTAPERERLDALFTNMLRSPKKRGAGYTRATWSAKAAKRRRNQRSR